MSLLILILIPKTGEFLTEECGTLGYTAPEIYDPGKYNQSADVFSFSMVLWQLFSNNPELPYHDHDKILFMNQLETGKRPAFNSEHPGLIIELLEYGWYDIIIIIIIIIVVVIIIA